LAQGWGRFETGIARGTTPFHDLAGTIAGRQAGKLSNDFFPGVDFP